MMEGGPLEGSGRRFGEGYVGGRTTDGRVVEGTGTFRGWTSDR